MFRKIFIILIAVAFVLGVSRISFAMSCGGDTEEHSVHHQKMIAQSDSKTNQEPAESTALPAAKETVNVGNKICPVTGEEINEKTKATYEYEGKIYNLCCPMCIDEFKKDPEKYIKKVEEEMKETRGEKAKESKEMAPDSKMSEEMSQKAAQK